jgi:hypothetical protein
MPEPSRSLLENLLGGSPPKPRGQASNENAPSPVDSDTPADAGGSALDLSARPSALSLGLICAGSLALLLLLLKFVSQRRQLAAVGTVPERVLPPDQIQGRMDIVTAYHQLARRAGRSYRPWWHHRQIEALLLQTFPGRRSAITRLAGVYEQSRYAPDSIPLTPADLQTARDALRECHSGVDGKG